MPVLCEKMSGVCLLLNNSYSKLTLCNGKLKINRKAYQLISTINRMNATYSFNQNYVKSSSPFEQLIDQRKAEARKTAIIQVSSKNSIPKLLDECLNYGEIQSVHHYGLQDNTQYALVEFMKYESLKKVLRKSCYMDLDVTIPTYSRFLWFKNTIQLQSQQNLSKKGKRYEHLINYSKIYKNAEITSKLNQINSVTEQINTLHDHLRLNETEIRLRFVTVLQLEESISCFFPAVKIWPFGSSISGFGKQGCDLDLAMDLKDVKMQDGKTRFVYQTKTTCDTKMKTNACMTAIACQMDHLMPGIRRVKKILKARVPIIKFYHDFTGLNCDLSMTNMTGVHMAELLFLYGEIDNRVRPLIFTIREWAKCCRLTNNDPGKWITNFSLTLLVIFYLQTKNIVPSLNRLYSLADGEDTRIADDGVDCTFLRDIKKLPQQTKNCENLDQLLQDFFYYYEQFDFSTHAVSIREARKIKKPDFSPMYICNPLEITLNVSKNVTADETSRLVKLCSKSLNILKSGTNKQMGNKGLLNIFGDSDQHLSINISDLFDNSEEDVETKQPIVEANNT